MFHLKDYPIGKQFSAQQLCTLTWWSPLAHHHHHHHDINPTKRSVVCSIVSYISYIREIRGVALLLLFFGGLVNIILIFSIYQYDSSHVYAQLVPADALCCENLRKEIQQLLLHYVW